ncbi:MAG: heme ABC exporter ATP-binding protein CcmA [Acidimicrobiia bacterium]|nr:heme ABC exporter ATP-binding protein CcmA [Acidimicrobiia bacterium]
MIDPLLHLRAVGVRLGDTPILRGVDLRVGAGEVVGLVGANGSGKTTLLRIAATLLVPTSGEGEVLGAGLTDEARYAVRNRIGLIGHTPALYPNLTLEENTRFVAQLMGAEPGSVGASLDQVGLAGARHRRAIQCSHGMQRRAEFARLLISKPVLVLLDEAHAGLDRHAADLVAFILQDVRSRGGGAMLVSHEHNRMAPLVDRVVELRNGAVGDWEAE